MELKCEQEVIEREGLDSSNCTFMELKCWSSLSNSLIT